MAAARFTGDSCAICTASADVVAEMARASDGRGHAALDDRGRAEPCLQADVRPTRMRCVALPLTVLQQALDAA